MMMWLSAGVALTALAGAGEDLPYRETQNVVYGEAGGAGLVMDVFTPVKADGPGRGLGVVCVASAGWNADRSTIEVYRTLGAFDMFCSRGYVVFAVRPGSLPVFTGLEMLDHVRTGIRYVKAHAAEYGVDGSRLGLFWVSAGGHLSCLAATRAEPGDPQATDPLKRLDSQVKAVVAFCAPTDFLNWPLDNEALKLVKGPLAFRDVPANPTEGQLSDALTPLSPARFVRAGLPPFWLIHGDADSIVPYQQAELFAKALKDAGNSVELTTRPGGEHAWPSLRDDIGLAADWLAAQLRAQDPEAARP